MDQIAALLDWMRPASRSGAVGLDASRVQLQDSPPVVTISPSALKESRQGFQALLHKLLSAQDSFLAFQGQAPFTFLAK